MRVETGQRGSRATSEGDGCKRAALRPLPQPGREELPSVARHTWLRALPCILWLAWAETISDLDPRRNGIKTLTAEGRAAQVEAIGLVGQLGNDQPGHSRVSLNHGQAVRAYLKMSGFTPSCILAILGSSPSLLTFHNVNNHGGRENCQGTKNKRKQRKQQHKTNRKKTTKKHTGGTNNIVRFFFFGENVACEGRRRFLKNTAYPRLVFRCSGV